MIYSKPVPKNIDLIWHLEDNEEVVLSCNLIELFCKLSYYYYNQDNSYYSKQEFVFMDQTDKFLIVNHFKNYILIKQKGGKELLRIEPSNDEWDTLNYQVFKIIHQINDEIIHNYSTYQNEDGTFTYTLPEYTRENKTLLGYVENRMVGETLQQTFIPAGEYTTDATGLTFIALWGEFTTIDGASIRISSAETSGIRWTTTIDAEGYVDFIGSMSQQSGALSADEIWTKVTDTFDKNWGTYLSNAGLK